MDYQEACQQAREEARAEMASHHGGRRSILEDYITGDDGEERPACVYHMRAGARLLLALVEPLRYFLPLISCNIPLSLSLSLSLKH